MSSLGYALRAAANDLPHTVRTGSNLGTHVAAAPRRAPTAAVRCDRRPLRRGPALPAGSGALLGPDQRR